MKSLPAFRLRGAALSAAALLAALLLSGCASSPAPSRHRRGDMSHERVSPHEARELHVRVRAGRRYEYGGDELSAEKLAKRLRRDAVSSRGRNVDVKTVVLAARGEVPMAELQALRDFLVSKGLPYVVIRGSRVSTVTGPGIMPAPPRR
ncbi:MAG: hypothetical protein IJ678_08970 [Kiritimatiellae bacterium]|nr:hypothetical protein [Kiritimatiellia bacterium]